MQLLVSVQNQEEACTACAGGAGIIDAKDPTQGALGPVTRETMREIVAAVPAGTPVSAALGDVASLTQLQLAVAGLPAGLAFVKVGFAAESEAARVEELLSLAVRLTQSISRTTRVVAVAYADSAGLALEQFPALVQQAGGHGLLVDTSIKDGRSLPDHVPVDQLLTLGAALASRGLAYALGGSLSLRHIPMARAAGADIIGVRGAVTVGGRSERIDPTRVAAFASAVRESVAASPR